jgi:hypothetical protein
MTRPKRPTKALKWRKITEVFHGSWWEPGPRLASGLDVFAYPTEVKGAHRVIGIFSTAEIEIKGRSKDAAATMLLAAYRAKEG